MAEMFAELLQILARFWRLNLAGGLLHGLGQGLGHGVIEGSGVGGVFLLKISSEDYEKNFV